MTHFGAVNHVARQVASNHRPHTRPVFLIGKTDLRQLRSVVVTWDATSCRHGTDIEMLYGLPSSLPASRHYTLSEGAPDYFFQLTIFLFERSKNHFSRNVRSFLSESEKRKLCQMAQLPKVLSRFYLDFSKLSDYQSWAFPSEICPSGPGTLIMV